MMRLLSVFMSRTKTSSSSSSGSKQKEAVSASSSSQQHDASQQQLTSSAGNSSFLSSSTAQALLQKGGLEFCLKVLGSLLKYWKKAPPEEVGLFGVFVFFFFLVLKCFHCKKFFHQLV